MVVVAVVVSGFTKGINESCVKLRKTFRNHVNEAGEGFSAAKLFALKISLCNCARLLNTAAQLCRRNSDRN